MRAIRGDVPCFFTVDDCWQNHFIGIEMNENEIKGERGVCWTCPYYVQYSNFCDYYKIYLNNNGYEPTCDNPELEKVPEIKDF